MEQMFNDTTLNTQVSVDLTIQMSSLEKMLIKEMKTWWDLYTLCKYLDKNIITRGKFPTTIYNVQFVKDWENILTDCSCKLMQLIVVKEGKKFCGYSR